MVSKSEKTPLYLIDWWDHCSSQGSWNTLDTVKSMTPILIRSIGFLVAETDQTITLASHYDDSGTNISGDICILKTCIKRKKKISYD